MGDFLFYNIGVKISLHNRNSSQKPHFILTGAMQVSFNGRTFAFQADGVSSILTTCSKREKNMERIKVIYKPHTEVVFDAPDGAYNDITNLLMAEQRPTFVSSLSGSVYKFCLSLEDILFVSLEKTDIKEPEKIRVGF